MGWFLLTKEKVEMHKDLKEIKFSDVQKDLLMIFADGKGHLKEELYKVCGVNPKTSFKYELTVLRKKLRAVGHDIVTVYEHPNTLRYRHVITLDSSLGGRR